MFNLKFAEKLGALGLIAGVISFGYSCYLRTKLNKAIGAISTIEKVLDKSVKELSEMIPVDISPEIVKFAVDRSVNAAVDKAARNVYADAADTLRTNLQREVRNEVNNIHINIVDSVSKEVASQVSRLNMRRLEDEVKAKAKEMVLEKFNGSLDSTLADFNQNLTNVSKIYSSIAENMSAKKKDHLAIYLDSIT